MFAFIPSGVDPLWYFIAIALAVIITGIAKAGFGGGIGVLAVPLTLMVLPPRSGLGLMLPILIIADLFTCYHFLGIYSKKHLRWLCVGAVLGVALATILLFLVQQSPAVDRILNITVGVICLLVVAAQVYRLVGGYMPHFPPTSLAGHSVGTAAGFVSTIAHSAGPLVNVYLLEQKLDKTLLVGTCSVYYLLINSAKVPTFVALGFINTQTLWALLWTIPLIPVGTLTGYWMHKHIPERPFTITMYVGATVGAIFMIYKGVA